MPAHRNHEQSLNDIHISESNLINLYEAVKTFDVKDLSEGIPSTNSKISTLDDRYNLSNLDFIGSSLSQLLVIRSCGHLETTLREAIQALFGNISDERHNYLINNYLINTYPKSLNPSPDKIKGFLKKIDESWYSQFSDFLKNPNQATVDFILSGENNLSRDSSNPHSSVNDSFLFDELHYLVKQRNNIAHGQSSNLGRQKALMLCRLSIACSNKLVDIIHPIES